MKKITVTFEEDGCTTAVSFQDLDEYGLSGMDDLLKVFMRTMEVATYPKQVVLDAMHQIIEEEESDDDSDD